MQKIDINKKASENQKDADISSLQSRSPVKTLFILGNPLPKLGDKTALNKFLEGSRGDTANQQAPVQSLVKAPFQLEIENKSGFVMPPVLDSNTRDPRIFQTYASIENIEIREDSKETLQYEDKKVKQDFPPPITSIFSFNLPSLAAKKLQDMKKEDSQVQALQNKNYSMSSLENQALNYLSQLQESQSKYDSPEETPTDCTQKIPEVLAIDSSYNLSNTITNKPNISLSQKNSFFSSQPNIY